MTDTVKDIQDLSYERFGSLPNTLTKENLSLFSKACEYVDDLCNDPKSFRLLMPFHNLTFGWQSAYASGFTWDKFLNEIIEDHCTTVDCVITNFGPRLLFKNGSLNKRPEFCISMEHDD